MFRTKLYKNLKTLFVFINVFFSENRNVYEIMLKNIIAPDVTDDNIVRHMRFAWWINKATDTHSEYVTIIAFLHPTVVTRTRLNGKFYVHSLPCYSYKDNKFSGTTVPCTDSTASYPVRMQSAWSAMRHAWLQSVRSKLASYTLPVYRLTQSHAPKLERLCLQLWTEHWERQHAGAKLRQLMLTCPWIHVT